MKKLIMSLVVILLLSGCAYPNITRLDKLNYEQIMYTILPLKVRSQNTNGNGYKYYIPKGIVRLKSKKYNEVLKRNDYKYYLYVDVVDYYYKNELEYKKNDNAYYSDIISYKDNKGYLEINKDKNGKMYVVMYYNYGRIETFVAEKDLPDVVSDMSYILASMKFNDSLLTQMYEAGTLGAKEETYKLFENKEKEGNFIEYVEEYDNYKSTNSSEMNMNAVETE